MKVIKNDCTYTKTTGAVVCDSIAEAVTLDFGIKNGVWTALVSDLFTYDATTKKYTLKL